MSVIYLLIYPWLLCVVWKSPVVLLREDREHRDEQWHDTSYTWSSSVFNVVLHSVLLGQVNYQVRGKEST